MLFSCQLTKPELPIIKDEKPDPEPPAPEVVEDKYGVAYMYDSSVIPEIHVTVPLDEWNSLLKAYDQNSKTKKNIHCDVRYLKDKEETVIKDAAIRLRGNTSRRRPEGSNGQMHKSSGTDWHHCHFQINFRKFQKDDEHEIHGARKIALKWFKDDPNYVRELYCYDLFRRAGIWTAPNDVYCRLWLKVEGDQKETYFGVYNMIEPIDERFVKQRVDEFGSDEGFIWKCRYGADLRSTGADIGADLDDDVEHVYELKNSTKSLDKATEQLKGFITKLNTLKGSEFHDWIASVCDVDLLMRTYAVNVTLGMWDDYWNNKNNYYIYFNSTDQQNYKFFFIPYDYDNTLGTSSKCGAQSDSGRHDPFNWGVKENPLIYKILQFDDYREIYRKELLRLVKPEEGLFYYTTSMQRIQKWQMSVKQFVSNDTGEDMSIKDAPASWSNHPEYRLLTSTTNENFFRVKETYIKQFCNK